MAKYSVMNTGITPSAFASGGTLTDNNYHFALQGGGTSQRILVSEFYLGGQSTSSAVSILLVARDSTVGVTLSDGTGLRPKALIDGAATAPSTAPTTFNVATTDPVRSSSLELLNLTFNAFGGIVRWVAPPGGELGLVSNVANVGEISLSGFTGTAGISGAHMIFEVM